MTTNVKRIIGRMTDDKELREIEKAAAARRRLLAERKYDLLCAETWERIKAIPIGTTLHVCATGTFFGGPFQRGDSMTLTHMQQRAKRIWVEAKGNRYWFEPKGMRRYDLRTSPPEKALDAESRATVERIAARIDDVRL